MAALVDSRGYNLTPKLGISRGGILGLAQLQQMGQQNIALDKREQIKSILSQQQGGQPTLGQAPAQPQVDPITGQAIPQTAPAPQILSLEEKKEMARNIDPIEAEKVFTALKIDKASHREEASRFGSQLESTPSAQRAGLIHARIQKLQSEGRDATETMKLLDMDEQQQNQAALGIQLADLSTKERFAYRQKRAAIAGKLKTGVEVKSSKILDDGTTVQVMKDGTTQVTSPGGAVLSGDERVSAIQEAQEFGVDIQQRRAKGRRVGTETAKVALNAFDRVGKIRQNIDDLNEGIRLVREEGAETGPIASKLPSFRAATKRLDNLQGRLGLNVVGAVTFGALSKGELDLAKDVALPKGLNEDEIVDWMEVRVAAQQKLANNLEDAALFLSDPENTVADLIRRNRAMAKAAKKKSEAKSSTTPQTVGRFQVRVKP